MDYYSLNDTHKKMAAIRSAAKNATNPVTAVADYMMSTGLADHVKAKEEMFSILPGYRHPVNDFIVEGWIFFAGFELDCVSNSWNTPDWFDELTRIPSIPKLLLDQVRQYVKNSELKKIDLNSTKNELLQKNALLDNAYDDFQPRVKKEKYYIRAKRVVEGLGLPEKRRDAHDPEDLYKTYVRLVRHEGLSRKKATFKVANIFNLTIYTTLQSLNDTRAIIKKSWQQYDLKQYNNTAKRHLKDLIKPKASWDSEYKIWNE